MGAVAGVGIEQTVPTVQSLNNGSASKGARTRDRIMDLAYDRIVEKGFTGTSIEELVEAAGITKSGFFYHFKDKNDLARQVLERYLGEVDQILDGLEARARELDEDPLHSFLIFLKLYAEALGQVVELHRGCLVSAITYQDRCFDAEVRRINANGFLHWRGRFRRWIDEIIAVHPPRVTVDPEALADQMTVVADGSIILSRGVADSSVIARQALLHREMIRLLFAR
jgi:TetR/AcrR family transcriptional regulator, transcriptional repressor for nem operon